MLISWAWKVRGSSGAWQTFNDTWTFDKYILHCTLLANNEKAKKIGEQLQIVTRQPKNLQRLVSGTTKGGWGGTPSHDAGCYKCKKCKVLCPILKEGNNL